MLKQNPQALHPNNKESISSSHGLEGSSIFWGGLVRVDVLKVLPGTRLTFYGPKALQIHVVPTEEADEFYEVLQLMLLDQLLLAFGEPGHRRSKRGSILWDKRFNKIGRMPRSYD